MAHPVDIHVGQQLKRIRSLRKMSQSDVAHQLNLSFQQLQKYEIGSNRISASRLYELSKILDVPVSFFFEGLEKEAHGSSPKNTLGIVKALAKLKDDKDRLRVLRVIEDLTASASGK